MHKIQWLARAAFRIFIALTAIISFSVFSPVSSAIGETLEHATPIEDTSDSASNTPAPRLDLVNLEKALSERSIGAPDAPITMVEHSSMSCPHCAEFHKKTLPRLKEKYIDTGKVRLVIVDFPLDRAALYASMLTRCASEKRYFSLVDLLFRTQARWATAKDPTAVLEQTGRLAGVGKQLFNACIHHKELEEGIYKKMLNAKNNWHIKSTPTFVFNEGEAKIEGSLPYEEFVKTIDGLLGE